MLPPTVHAPVSDCLRFLICERSLQGSLVALGAHLPQRGEHAMNSGRACGLPVSTGANHAFCRCKANKTHLAIAIARSCIRSGARGRFYNVVDLVNRLETETRNGRLACRAPNPHGLHRPGRDSDICHLPSPAASFSSTSSAGQEGSGEFDVHASST